ncbi:restriction endonuclease [Bacillus massiliglaciei]|uniref:restriction endonuclease n=1 Tax=Bacillus massiliglaciei TaxID=1816693 RepID=UPI003899383B
MLGIKWGRNRNREKRLANSGIKDIDKMDGFQFEVYLKVLFKKLGYAPLVTKKSGDFGVDLLLKGSNQTIAIQAKRYGYGNKVSIKAIQEVYAGGKFYSADENWVVTNSFFTKSALQLAEACNVRLVNRHQLQDLILKINPDKTPADVRKEVPSEKKKCPKCKSGLVLRKGKSNDEFYGCSNYPNCTYTANIYEIS